MLSQILSALDALGVDRKQALRLLMSDEDVLTMVKRLLGITDDSEDDVLTFIIQTIEGQVLRYINWDTLPDELQNILVVMVVSYYKSAGLGDTAAATGPIASVKRGDVTTSFATSSAASGSANTFNMGADNGEFFGWRTVLNEWRKVRW